jgi:sporulation protein YlmC with PRC-barrel domain
MKSVLAFTTSLLVATGTAMAAGELKTSVPPSTQTVTDWYKQSVYDPNNTKIGEIMDVLIAPDGKIDTLIVGVGGFLGAGEKDVAVNFEAIKKTNKENSTYLTMNTTRMLSNPPPDSSMIARRRLGCRSPPASSCRLAT